MKRKFRVVLLTLCHQLNKAKVLNYQNKNRIQEVELKIHFRKMRTPFDRE